MRASVPPSIPGPNVTGPIVRTPSTASGTPVPGGARPSSSNAGNVPPTAASGGNALSTGSSSNNNNQSSSNTVASGQLPPLPANVQLNPAITQITPVPLIDSLKLIPEIPEGEIKEIQGWMKRDKEYEVAMRKMKERMGIEMRGLFGGNAWWEKGAASVDVNRWKRGREGFDVRYPLRRGKEKEGRERRKRQREGLRLYVFDFCFRWL
jgi:SWI/SNF-related matrix-associated actin-dependent regulator of chromatin subfamily B protein 1